MYVALIVPYNAAFNRYTFILFPCFIRNKSIQNLILVFIFIVTSQSHIFYIRDILSVYQGRRGYVQIVN